MDIATKEAGRNLSPQLYRLCPSRVQQTAIPRVVQRFSGSYPATGTPDASVMTSTVPAADRYRKYVYIVVEMPPRRHTVPTRV